MNQPGTHLDDRDLAAETPVHLRELETDIAASDDDQVGGEEIHIHHGGVGQILYLVEAGHAGDYRPPSYINENPLRGEPLGAHAHFEGSFEAGGALIYRAVLHALQP